MREFNLSHAISAFSTYSGSISSLWGLYIAATFSAAGFAASRGADFPTHMAVILTVAYLVFTASHLLAILANLKVQQVIAGEIGARLQEAQADLTDYPRSLAAVLRITLSPAASIATHLAIDSCVVAIVLSTAFLG